MEMGITWTYRGNMFWDTPLRKTPVPACAMDCHGCKGPQKTIRVKGTKVGTYRIPLNGFF